MYSAHGGQKRASDPLEMELQTAMGLCGVPGIQPRSFRRTVSASDCQAISPGHHYLSCFTEKWCRSSLEHSVLFALWAWGLSKTEMTMCVPVRAAVFRASSTGMWGGAECTGRGLGTGPAGWAFHLTDEPHWASSGWPLWRLRYYSLLTRLIPVLSCPQLATS